MLPAGTPRPARGLVAEEPSAWARAHGADLVSFDAPRDGAISVTSWLDAACAIAGRSRPRAFVGALLRQAGLSLRARTAVAALAAHERVALALAEAAALRVEGRAIVVPEPPLPWPLRHESRRLALSLLAGAGEVILHARRGWEIAGLVSAIELDGGGAASARSIVLRVYGGAAPYAAFREKLEALGVEVQGGPIAHVLETPEGISVREILAAASAADLDVLEIRAGA
jgi:hypothetical protein